MQTAVIASAAREIISYFRFPTFCFSPFLPGMSLLFFLLRRHYVPWVFRSLVAKYLSSSLGGHLSAIHSSLWCLQFLCFKHISPWSSCLISSTTKYMDFALSSSIYDASEERISCTVLRVASLQLGTWVLFTLILVGLPQLVSIGILTICQPFSSPLKINAFQFSPLSTN